MKVLMVFLGNICRSPLAHGILQREIQRQGLNWEVESAGTSSWHNGELPDSRSIEVAKINGIDITDQRSRLFVAQDLETYDLIIAMDSANYKDIVGLASLEDQKNKVKLLLNYTYPDQNRGVPDPYYHGGFQKVFEMIEAAVLQLVENYR